MMSGGGQVNGSAFYGATKDDLSKGILIPTVLQMTKDAVAFWTHMTCLYDPYWTPENGKITLPICMFSVKKIVPTRTVEFLLLIFCDGLIKRDLLNYIYLCYKLLKRY